MPVFNEQNTSPFYAGDLAIADAIVNGQTRMAILGDSLMVGWVSRCLKAWAPRAGWEGYIQHGDFTAFNTTATYQNSVGAGEGTDILGLGNNSSLSRTAQFLWEAEEVRSAEVVVWGERIAHGGFYVPLDEPLADRTAKLRPCGGFSNDFFSAAASGGVELQALFYGFSTSPADRLRIRHDSISDHFNANVDEQCTGIDAGEYVWVTGDTLRALPESLYCVFRLMAANAAFPAPTGVTFNAGDKVCVMNWGLRRKAVSGLTVIDMTFGGYNVSQYLDSARFSNAAWTNHGTALGLTHAMISLTIHNEPGYTKEQFKAATKELIGKLRLSNPQMGIVLVAQIQTSNDADLNHYSTFADAYAEVAVETPRVLFLNLYRAAGPFTPQYNAGYWSGGDLVHPTEAGYLHHLRTTWMLMEQAAAANSAYVDYQTAMINLGYTAARAAKLDNLDAPLDANVVTWQGAEVQLSVGTIPVIQAAGGTIDWLEGLTEDGQQAMRAALFSHSGNKLSVDAEGKAALQAASVASVASAAAEAVLVTPAQKIKTNASNQVETSNPAAAPVTINVDETRVEVSE